MPLRIVIKLGETSLKSHGSTLLTRRSGTSSIVDEKTHEPMLFILSNIVSTAVKLHKSGHKVIIVSSGAVGVGLRRMNYEKRPKRSAQIQALAAIGQCRLMTLWDQLFELFGQPIAQILLTRNDIADVCIFFKSGNDSIVLLTRQRTQYLNAQNTFRELLEIGVIPIVNENDTISLSEIKFGDNDTLSAITAAMVHAHYLFLMTDVDCLYDKNPRNHPDAKAIEVVNDISALQADVSSAGSSLGTGGMSTKIVAARLATSAGVTTVIARSSNPGNIIKIVEYVQNLKPSKTITTSSRPVSPEDLSNPKTEKYKSLLDTTKVEPIGSAPIHTRFIASENPIRDRHFWILHGLTPHGTLYIDVGAHCALKNRAGLFAAGVVDVEGNFAQFEAVRIVEIDCRTKDTSTENLKICKSLGAEVGRALVNYSAAEIARIKGAGSSDIQNILGYADSEYVALRENVSLFNRPTSPCTSFKQSTEET
ncbi:Glutamate 5-kinase [Golovinomyces cichoracearum]|uniref:Glutamate 5-kinase n=1 Tax=Golovinomyces cichoracearum TaxID=62708 RepID=A0A420JBF5_9PEZI|nr:Glutamate 5-kinase [Golovinomyces cichoracearum]